MQNDNAKLKVKESVHLEQWPDPIPCTLNPKVLLADMEEVRRIVSLGLEARAKANIKVRQPLKKLKVKSEKLKVLDYELIQLIKAEVNVKEVVFEKNLVDEVELDTAITPELKEEGLVRELVRTIQEMRKEARLEPKKLVRLEIAADEQAKVFIEKHFEVLKRQTNVSTVVFVELFLERTIDLGEFKYQMRLVF